MTNLWQECRAYIAAVPRRIIDHLLYVVYVNGLVMAAFDIVGREAWTNRWRRRRPSVVAMWERSPGAARGRQP